MEEVIDQAPEQSVADKIAAKFGFPGQAEEEQALQPQAPAQPEDAFAEIEFEGEKFKVPTKLKDGFMKNQDYTQKTQELAESRRTMDQMRDVAQTKQMESAFAESIAQETQELNVIEAYLSQVSKLDWAQMPSDQLLRQKIEVDNIKERREFLKSQVTEKRSQFNESVKTKINDLRTKSRELAAKTIQGFTDETEKAVRSFAQVEGLSEAEIDNVLLDPRSYKIVWKAMQFDKVQAGTQPAKEKAEKLLKPGGAGNEMPKATINKLNFGKAMKAATTSGEKARVIEDRLAGVFGR